MTRRTALALLLTLTPALAWAGPPLLDFPLDCTLGETCFIQQYVDADPGKNSQDFTCGPLSYDGHKGTDIRVVHKNQIKGRGIDVHASAVGRVLGTRNTMPDSEQRGDNSPDVSGKECGNGIVIDHGDGWHSQYCHMRQGSINVRTGQKVNKGAVLGKIGLSGLTQFPHLHIKVTKDGKVVDPFNPEAISACNVEKPQLWTQPVAYQAGGLLSVGFAASAVKFEEVRSGLPDIMTLPGDAPAIILWGFAFGLQKGDVLKIMIQNPDGSNLIDQEFQITRNRAEAYRLAGKKRRQTQWPIGTYQGHVTITRSSKTLSKQKVTLQVR